MSVWRRRFELPQWVEVVLQKIENIKRARERDRAPIVPDPTKPSAVRPRSAYAPGPSFPAMGGANGPDGAVGANTGRAKGPTGAVNAHR